MQRERERERERVCVCVCCRLYEKMADSYRWRTTYRAGGLLSLRGAVILSSSQSLWHGERLVWNNASDFLAHATRFSTLTYQIVLFFSKTDQLGNTWATRIAISAYRFIA